MRGLIQQKQEAAHSLLQVLTEYFLGERLIPVGPMDSQYAAYVSALATHHRLIRLVAAEEAADDAGHSETIQNMVHGTIRLHLPERDVASFVGAGFIEP